MNNNKMFNREFNGGVSNWTRANYSQIEYKNYDLIAFIS